MNSHAIRRLAAIADDLTVLREELYALSTYEITPLTARVLVALAELVQAQAALLRANHHVRATEKTCAEIAAAAPR